MLSGPLHLGTSQGLAIRLGSSRSLKVYRGMRELGSSDLVLTIHDEFNGPGSGDTSMIGWTPDQISNGNTWTEPSSHSWPSSSTGFKVNSSGYAYKNNYDRSADGGFNDKVIIDCGTSGNVRLESRCLCGNQDFAGLCMWASPTSDVPGISANFRRNNNGSFSVGVNDGTTSTTLKSVTGLTTAGYDLVNRCFLTMELSGSILTVELYEEDQTTLIDSYTGSIAGYGLTPTNYVGMQMAGFSNSTRQHYDFKVYTPPVVATRKVDWDTWEDGIAAYDMGAGTSISSYFYPTKVKDSQNYEVTARARALSYTEFNIRKFDNSVNNGNLDPPPPYIALWWERTGSTVVRAWFVAKLRNGSSGVYDFVEASNGQTQFHASNNSTGQFAIVNLSKKPTNLANWRDYDGPTA